MSEGPLSNLRVVEMGQLIAGPFCGQLLGDMGAEVIKIEPPGRPDPIRTWGQAEVDGHRTRTGGRALGGAVRRGRPRRTGSGCPPRCSAFRWPPCRRLSG